MKLKVCEPHPHTFSLSHVVFFTQEVDDEQGHTLKKPRVADGKSALPPDFFDSGVTMETTNSVPSQLPASVPAGMLSWQQVHFRSVRVYINFLE